MHVTLDQFNLLLADKATPTQRNAISDHILSCDACATRFRALHSLDRDLKKPAVPVRYILGVAAVMFMCLVPYFSEQKATPFSNHDVYQNTASASTFAVADRVIEVNYQQALSEWGSQSDTRELIRLRNKL